MLMLPDGIALDFGPELLEVASAVGEEYHHVNASFAHSAAGPEFMTQAAVLFGNREEKV